MRSRGLLRGSGACCAGLRTESAASRRGSAAPIVVAALPGIVLGNWYVFVGYTALVLVMAQLALILRSSSRVKFQRGDTCGDCCFDGDACSCRLLGINVLQSFFRRRALACPCCFDDAFVDWRHANRELLREYRQALGAAILGAFATIAAGYGVIIKLLGG